MELKRHKCQREIKLENGVPESNSLPSNRISTGNHALHGFVLTLLVNQCTRLSTLWFIFISILSLGVFHLDYQTSYIPCILLLIHILITLTRDGVAIVRRNISDRRMNREQFAVWTGDKFEFLPCEDIKVGHCVLVYDKGRIPADSVVLATSAEDGGCYISTGNILGENSLDVKQAVKELQRSLPNYDNPPSFNFHRLRAVAKVSPPHSDYQSFDGKLKIHLYPRASVLDIRNFLLRGSRVYSTSWILCLAVYTGMETKVWLDRTRAPRKVSTFTRTLNYFTLSTATFLLLISALMTLFQYFFSREKVNGQDFLVYLLGLSREMPVMMYIALDIARIVIMWRFSRKSKQSVFKYGYISEDLAKISFILMDKTGTLTENKLKVTEIVIQNHAFIRDFDSKKTLITDNFHHFDTSSTPRIPQFDTFHDLSLHLQNCERNSVFYYFCECVALCHSVIAVGKDKYKATSADEKAIVRAARKFGCAFLNRSEDECTIEIFGSCMTYSIICIRKFTPELRRMRVLVQGLYDQHATLYIKGNYAVLRDFLKMTSEEREKLEGKLEEMMHKGLRTMMLCYRRIEGVHLAEVKQLAINYRLSRTNMEAKMEILLKDLEKELTYIGIIGIQDMVKTETLKCLDSIKSMGIQTWMMSGDSESNTLATAYSVGLIDPDVKLVSLRGLNSTDLCTKRMHSIAKEHLFHRPPIDTNRENFQSSVINWSEFHPETVNFALSIDHISLQTALKTPLNTHFLLTMLTTCPSVFFNTLYPSDKRSVTKLLMKGQNTHPKVLCIGDDGSNMPMVLEADVGVGIDGKDDQITVNNSDIAVANFTEVEKLVEVGKVNAEVMCRIVVLFVYAVTVLEVVAVVYMVLGNVTPVYLHSLELSILYTAVIVLIPILCLALTESSGECSGKKGWCSLTAGRIIQYLLLAILHSGVCLALVLPAFYVKNASRGSTAELSCTLFLVLVVVVNQHCWQESSHLSLWFLLSSFLSIGLTLLYIPTQTTDTDLHFTLNTLFTTPSLLLSLLLTPFPCGILSFFFLFHRNNHSVLSGNKITPLLIQRSVLMKIRNESCSMINLYTKDGAMSSLNAVLDANSMEIDTRRMKFKSPLLETNYLNDFLLNNNRLLSISVFIFILQIALNLSKIKNYHDIENFGVILAISGAILVLLLVILGWKSLELMHYFSFFVLIGTLIINILTENYSEFIYFSLPIGLLFLSTEKWRNAILISIFAFLGSFLTIFLKKRSVKYDDFESEWWIQVLGYVVIQGIVTFVGGKEAWKCGLEGRREYKLIQEAEEKIGQSENILSCLLPEFVRKRVKNGIRYIAEDKDSVSILFCEICDFDTICADYSPTELTALIDDIFQKIDELCEAMGVAKIETVGKVYMACSGLCDFESELTNEIRLISPEQRVAELALAILSSFKLYKLQSGKMLQFKIGINTGPVIAGVVGHHKPQFSLVGDTVNTASRMSTTITTPNTVQVSPSTYEALTPYHTSYDFHPNLITVKGKGDMTAYTLRRKTIPEFAASRLRNNTEENVSNSARRSDRKRSSVSLTLRSSLNFDEAVEMNDKELIEEVVIYQFTWKEQESERLFRLHNANMKLSTIELGLHVYILGVVLLAVAGLVLGEIRGNGMYYGAGSMYVVMGGVGVGVRIYLKSLVRRWIFAWLMVALYICSVFPLYLELPAASELINDLLYVVLCTFLLLFYHCTGIFFRHALFTSLLIALSWLCVSLSIDTSNWHKSVFVILFSTQHSIFIYYTEKSKRAFFNLSKLAAREIEKNEQLLTQMLPLHAYEGLKDEQWVTDRLQKVTLLYADISGFTAWSASKSPQEVITCLSEIYTEFDKICVSLKGYKVHTIGDCYVAMSATSNSEMRDPGDECVVMLNFAAEMLRILQTHQSTSGLELKMRIGLHMGDVVAGITGSKLIRYDIYGTDVLIANKMESNGKAGCINVSEDVMKVLDERLSGFVEAEFNKKVEIPVAGRDVNCYLVHYRY